MYSLGTVLFSGEAPAVTLDKAKSWEKFTAWGWVKIYKSLIIKYL